MIVIKEVDDMTNSDIEVSLDEQKLHDNIINKYRILDKVVDIHGIGNKTYELAVRDLRKACLSITVGYKL